MTTKPSHPPSLLARVERCLIDECSIRGEARDPIKILVAVSGGPDSLALADALARLSRRLHLELRVAAVDHRLRAEAADEIELVQSFCRSRELPFEVRRVTVEGPGGLQAAARKARYEALWTSVKEAWGEEGLLATAHHAEDRAETVLLRILRGVSLEGLGVLPPRAGRLIRPLVRSSKEDILAHCERHGLIAASDPSNQDPRFLRVQVRQKVLPMLQDLSPGVVATLNGLADEADQLGEPLALNREQRRQLRRALSDPTRKIDLPLRGGLRLVRRSSKGTR